MSMICAARHNLLQVLLAMLRAARTQTVLLTNAAYVTVGAVTSAVFGFLFWSVAAGQVPADTIGMTSAVISAMSLVATISELGLGTLLMGPLLKRRERAPSIISAALIAALVATIALCLVWLAIAHLLALRLGDILGTRAASLLFIAGTVGAVLSLVIDSASTGLLVSSLRMFRELAFASGKLVLLIAVLAATRSHGGAMLLLLAWVAASLLSLLLMTGLARLRDIRLLGAPDFTLLHTMLPASLEHHALNLVATAPAMVLPILVTEVVSAEVNAVFFLALLILQVLLLGPASISSALYAVSTPEPSERRSRLRFSLLLAVVMCFGEMIAFILLFDFMLGLINPAYPTIAGPYMSYIGLAVPARSAKYFYIAVARLDGRMRQGSVLLAVCGALEVAGAAIGGVTAGSPGLVAGWLVSLYVEMGLLLPSVLAAAFARPSRVATTGTTAWPATGRDSTASGV
jgi:O-antigen/teichoic acid export membrane protein